MKTATKLILISSAAVLLIYAVVFGFTGDYDHASYLLGLAIVSLILEEKA